MRHLLVFALFFFSLMSHAQSIEKLDERYGFKEIKLGSEISSFDVIKVTKTGYIYDGNCCSTIFDASVTDIFVNTDDEDRIKFIRLRVVFDDKRKYEPKYFLQNLTTLFGVPSLVDFEKEGGEPTGNTSYMWSGNEATMVWNVLIQQRFEDGWVHTIDFVLNSAMEDEFDW